MYFIFDGNNEELARTGKAEIAVQIAMTHGNGASVEHGNEPEPTGDNTVVLVYNAEPSFDFSRVSHLARQMAWGETPYIN